MRRKTKVVKTYDWLTDETISLEDRARHYCQYIAFLMENYFNEVKRLMILSSTSIYHNLKNMNANLDEELTELEAIKQVVFKNLL